MAKNTKPEAIQLTCDICSENYTDPLMLTCLHSFCKKCLIKRKEEQGASDGCLKCPTCNTSTHLPDGKVEGLTQNCWLAHQVKVASLKDKMSSEKGVPCDRCVKRTSGSAVALCCHCCHFLCTSCKEDHQWWRETVNHELVDVGNKKSFVDDNVIVHVPHKPMYCSQHTDEKLKFYCHTCQILVCRDCIVIGHKDHQLDDYVKVSDSSKEELKQCLANCNKVIDTANDALANGNNMLQLIEKHEGEVNKEIEEVFDKLQAILESRRKVLHNQLNEIANKKRKGVKNQLATFEKLKKEVCYASQLTVAVVHSDDSGEILSISKLIKDQLAHFIEVFETSSFEIAETETMLTSLDVTSMSNDINRFGGVSAIDPSYCFIDTGLAVPMATVGKERKFTATIVGRAINGAGGVLNASLVSVDGVKEEVTVTESNNCITVSCVPQRVGQFELSLKVGSQHIKGSPYQFFVKQKRNYGSMQKQCIYNVGSYTYEVAVGTNGDVYASSANNGYIQVFNNNGTAIRTIGSKGNGNGQFNTPFGLVLVDDTLYVTDYGLHRVQMFAASTGKYIGQFGSNGTGHGQFTYPHGITYDGKGHILVAEYNNRRVQVFNMDGTFVQVIDCNGQYPTDVAVDNIGNIHVTNYSQHIVQVFSPDGITKIRTYSNPNGNFRNPRGIAIDDEGYCFITTNSPNYLHVLDPTGNQVNLIDGFNYPWGVALDRQGYVYIADYSKYCIMKF